MFRPLPAVLGVAMLWLVPAPGHGQLAGNARWCAVVNEGTGGMVWHCNYSRFEDCSPNVTAGNRGFCNENPYWLGAHRSTGTEPAAVAHPKHRKGRKHHVWRD